MRLVPPLPISALLLVVLFPACNGPTGPEDPPEPPDTTAINEDIVQVADCCINGRSAYYIMGDWTGDRIYATKFPRVFQLNDSLQSVRDSRPFVFDGDGRPINYMELSEDGTRLLIVGSFYADVSVGSLHEYDVQNGGRPIPSEVPVLRDSSYAVSSAVYLPGSEGEKVVYYSYGSMPESNENGPTPGYYLLDTTTGEDSLLVEHASPAGTEEIFNGFDVSPDGQTLLYPLQYTNIGRFKPPNVLAYDMETGTRDTLEVEFESQFVWLRYGSEGQQVLYGTYPFGALGYTDSGRSDRIGIIELSTMEKRVLETDPAPEAPSLDLFPRWSPSGRHIVYSSAPVAMPRGAIDNNSLYVLKNVN